MGGSRGGSVEPPKLNVKTYNKHVVKKSEGGGDFRAINHFKLALKTPKIRSHFRGPKFKNIPREHAPGPP